jgi:hypothetical protein
MDDFFWKATGLEEQLAGLHLRRTALCCQMAAANGKAKLPIGAELSQVNSAIKAINLKVSERREARSLWLAARSVLTDDQFTAFMDAARSHRMGFSVLS